ncbi:MAG TPA: hypothetical protein VFA63_13615 [Pseudonocardiaceae bacterium]|nr:hypothetical protein [Pseudonocardiaceae bacterium]
MGYPIGHPAEISDAAEQLGESRPALIETIQQRDAVIVDRVARRGNWSMSLTGALTFCADTLNWSAARWTASDLPAPFSQRSVIVRTATGETRQNIS